MRIGEAGLRWLGLTSAGAGLGDRGTGRKQRRLLAGRASGWAGMAGIALPGMISFGTGDAYMVSLSRT